MSISIYFMRVLLLKCIAFVRYMPRWFTCPWSSLCILSWELSSGKRWTLVTSSNIINRHTYMPTTQKLLPAQQPSTGFLKSSLIAGYGGITSLLSFVSCSFITSVSAEFHVFSLCCWGADVSFYRGPLNPSLSPSRCYYFVTTPLYTESCASITADNRHILLSSPD